MSKKNNLQPLLWVLFGLFSVGAIFTWILLPEMPYISITLAVLLAGDTLFLISENRKALSGRSAAYGVNSAVVVVLVISLVGVVNFLASRYPKKWDLTANKVHTLSDQTAKLMQGLTQPLELVFFGKVGSKERFRPLLENYQTFNKTKVKIEYVDPDKEPTRAKQLGITKYDTLHIVYADKTSRVEEITEEKLTNALMKLLKEKRQTLCAITGHGEKSFMDQSAEGYETMKKGLEEQSYTIKEVVLAQESQIPAECEAIAILGSAKAFFPIEIKGIEKYLSEGGRALIALDFDPKRPAGATELMQLLSSWHVKVSSGLVVDPFSRMLGVDASVPIVATFNKEHAITKESQGNNFMPFTRALDVLPNAPEALKVTWLMKTTPKSWGETDIASLAQGQAQLNEGKDIPGPITVAYAVEGKLAGSTATKTTRLVVTGSSLFASNNYARFGGNSDFFLNSMSWLLEDESLISIRAKEADEGKVELSQQAGMVVFLVAVVFLPLSIAIAGIVIWVRRRKL